MNTAEELISEMIENALYRMDESTRMIHKSLENVSEEELWQRPNDSLSSIANLIIHLCGNITQYAISSLGETADIRERDKEFSLISGYDKATLLQKLSETVGTAQQVMNAASTEQLLKKREVQGYRFSGIGIITHVVEHYSYHTGQIAFWVKQLKNKDLGFYEGVDLRIKNKLD